MTSSLKITVPASDVTKKNVKRFLDNPAYVLNVIRYMGGDMYRAILGYDVFWDKEAETNLVRCLDRYYHHLRDTGQYELEAYEVQEDSWVKGLPWRDNCIPYEDVPAAYRSFFLEKGCIIYVRKNEINENYKYDIEFVNRLGYNVIRSKPRKWKMFKLKTKKLKDVRVYELRRRGDLTNEYEKEPGTYSSRTARKKKL